MKRVINILCLLVLTLFISGYKYDLEVEVSEDKSVKMTEKMEFNNTELNNLVCFTPDACDLNEDNVKSGITSFYTRKNKNTTTVDGNFNIKFDSSSNSAKYVATYLFKDIDDIIGSINETFNLYNMDFSHKLFTINGKNYSFNTKYKSDADVEAKLTLKLPVAGEQTNADEKSDDGKLLTWNLKDNKNLSVKFELDSNVELVGGDQYNKIENNQFLMIGAGVIGGIIVLIVFLNIIKGIKKSPAPQTSVENQKFAVNEVFNSNANITTPVSVNHQPVQQPIELEQPNNHQDVISNKFLDDSFAGNSAPVEDSPVAPVSEETPVQPTAEPDVSPVIEETNTSNVVDTNPDMSSVAFGGAPIEDKNINEIK